MSAHNRTSPDAYNWYSQSSYYESIHEPFDYDRHYSKYSTLSHALAHPQPGPPPNLVSQLPSTPAGTTFSTSSPLVASGSSSSATSADSTVAPQTHPLLRRMLPTPFVPMPRYHSDDRTDWKDRQKMPGFKVAENVIFFLPNVNEFSSSGVPMTECLRSNVNGMKFPYDAVFSFMAERNLDTIVFKLAWPGYEDLQWNKSLSIYTAGRFITRVEVAYFIATEFKRFFEACDANKYQCTDPQWEVGRHGITFDRIILVSIWNAEGNIWLPSIQYIPKQFRV